MGERKSVNKYYPPEWRPEFGSINTFMGRHPLGARAKKIHEGIVIIRFELPFNVWCGGCGIHIAKGKRFNAEKKCVGNYFSTKIFNFRMRCHLCPNFIEIQTDPEHCDYVVVSGAKRKTETWQPSVDETGTLALKTDEDQKREIDDPFYKLEKSVEDEKKAKEAQPHVTELIGVQKKLEDDYALNAGLRKKFREEKHELKAQKEEGKKHGLGIKLLPLTEQDKLEADMVPFMKPVQTAEEERMRRRLEIKTSNIFLQPQSSSIRGPKGECTAFRLQVLEKAKKMDPSLLRKKPRLSIAHTSPLS